MKYDIVNAHKDMLSEELCKLKRRVDGDGEGEGRGEDGQQLHGKSMQLPTRRVSFGFPFFLNYPFFSLSYSLNNNYYKNDGILISEEPKKKKKAVSELTVKF